MTTKMAGAKIAKGLGIGLAVGGALGAVGGAMSQPHYARSAKKSVNKILKTVSGVVNAIS